MELWDVFDRNRKKIGKTHERGIPLPEDWYHLVVRILIQNDKGELLLTKRHPGKIFGNRWECTGGSVLTGESSLQGALREVKEEIGLELDASDGNLVYQVTKDSINSHYDLWLFQANAPINRLSFQPEEVIDAKWVNREEYAIMLERKELVPTGVHHFQLIDDFIKVSADENY